MAEFLGVVFDLHLFMTFFVGNVVVSDDCSDCIDVGWIGFTWLQVHVLWLVA